MGSRALLVRFANHLVNNNKQCKNLLSTSALCNKKVQGSDNLSLLKDDGNKSLAKSVPAKDSIQKDRACEGYIIIESEENAVGITSGVPEEHVKTRTVLISKPTKNAMQSGTDNTHGWQISFDTRERWENPLMGWCSSGDPLQALRVHFESKEAAIEHCKNMGWKYMVQKPNVVNPKPRSYGDNFSWNRRTRVSTK